ncbi:MAG: hypothetical protein D6715_12250 [Calditrichaeota bacterium]|nr:MAG: hypothetical protein D6715_12250 [Calditrichota bacterium]
MPMLRRWAVFDVDGTLLPGSALERHFLRWARRKGWLGFSQWRAFALQGLRALLRGKVSQALAGNKGLYRGLAPDLLQPEAKTLIDTLVRERFSQTGKRRLRQCQQQGFAILLMTGAPDFLAEPLAEVLGAEALICARLEIEQGRYTGRVLGLHPYGARKRQLLLQQQAALGLDFSASAVFANHHADWDHMRLFACPTAVNPTPRLRRLALRRGWPIEFWQD